jgi:IPT/TIG domain/PASTA domain
VRCRGAITGGALVAIVAALGSCAIAQGAIVTLGSSLNQTYVTTGISTPSTAINASLPHSTVVSPVNGAIVRWRVEDFFGPFALRVLTPDGGKTYTGAGTSTPETVAGLGLETFPTDLPIRAGQTIGIDNLGNSNYGVALTTGEAGFWQPPLADGASSDATTQINTELAFNADVQPAPTIATISPNSGFFKGGTQVTISGTDLEGASAVTFGSSPATSFTVNSESQLTAVAPPAPRASSSPVTVTTIAGTASSTKPFEAAACVVPKLRGQRLRIAKKKLKTAGCKIGKVKKLQGATSKTGKVKSQSPKFGRVLAPGSTVNVRLAA